MPDTPVPNIPVGQVLLHQYGLKQGTAFPASLLDEQTRLAWADHRSEADLRRKPLKEKALLVVVSQDCDIACHNDNHDPCVELAIFVPIKPKDRHAGNQFAHSTRQLQLSISGREYEAKVRHTIRVPKAALRDGLAGHQHALLTLPAEQCRILVLWRANRYQRAALPDRFNNAFSPLFRQALPEIEHIGQGPDDSVRSYIRSLYVHLDNMTEEDACQFSLLALLRADTPDQSQSAIDDAIDELCQQFEAASDFTLSESPELAGLAEKETTVTVAVLEQYVKLNLDYLSLRHGDPDTGV